MLLLPVAAGPGPHNEYSREWQLYLLFSFPTPQRLLPYPGNKNLELRNTEATEKEVVDFESAADVKIFKAGINGELNVLFGCYD